MFDLIVFLTLVGLGYFAGSAAERRHYRSIREREQQYLNLPAVSFRQLTNPERAERCRLVSGSVVISVDYFKRLLAGFRAVVGGRVKSYESLIDRARREAILRLKRQARGADEIVNVRIESMSLGATKRRGSVTTVEAFAYGTAIYYRK